ncbi:hypothetical protein B0H11DRAFT_2160931 [Mycena galericulata]|nr:hypothetical protein B0H11DRAFT_2160931 [Mycena galericulata]
MDVFFQHLNADQVFSVPSEENERSPVAERAFFSLLGLYKAAGYFVPGASYHRDPAVLKAWPGIFKWSAFFVTTRVTSTRPAAMDIQVQRVTMDIIAAVWVMLCSADGMREVIAATKGTLEIATRLWLLDDDVPASNTQFSDVPFPAAALEALLLNPAAADRALAAAGGKSEAVAKLAMARARRALSVTPLDPVPIAIHFNLLNHLSRGWDHPLRYALLQAGVIPLCTRAAGTLGRALSAGENPALLQGLVSAFGYLANCLDSTEGFTWVTQSVAADLMLSFADCSPHFGRLDADDIGIVCLLLKDILPRYLVYGSVVQAVHEGLLKLQPLQLKRIQASVVKKSWAEFLALADERHRVVLDAALTKDKRATCDNVQCHRIDAKNTFRKCSGCSTTLYCSKECQTIAWKEGGHRSMCKLKQQERLEGKAQAISKSDMAFFRHLSAYDAWHHVPDLRRRARVEHPTLHPTELVIRIDYTVVPPTYALIPLAAAHDDLNFNSALGLSATRNAEARSDALLERARENPGRYALIQSEIANGAVVQMMVSVVTAGFWDVDEENSPSLLLQWRSHCWRRRGHARNDHKVPEFRLNPPSSLCAPPLSFEAVLVCSGLDPYAYASPPVSCG